MGVKQYYRISVVNAIQLTKDSIEEVVEFLGDACLRVDEPSPIVVWFKPCYNAQYGVGIHEGSYVLRHPDGSFSAECQELFERAYKESPYEIAAMSDDEGSSRYKEVPPRVFKYAPEMYRLLKSDCPRCISFSGGNGDCDQCKTGILLYKIEEDEEDD